MPLILNLAEFRIRMAGRTQRQIAQAAGMKSPTLSKLLNGKANPTLKTIDRLAAALGCPAESLLISGENHE